jgi:hypothetical protein
VAHLPWCSLGSRARTQWSCHQGTSHLSSCYPVMPWVLIWTNPRREDSWIERMSLESIMLLFPFVYLALRVLFICAGDLSQRLSWDSVLSANTQCVQLPDGGSANWRSLLWSPVTSWQTEQSGLKLISRIRHSFISMITGYVQKEVAKKAEGSWAEVGTVLMPWPQGHASHRGLALYSSLQSLISH